MYTFEKEILCVVSDKTMVTKNLKQGKPISIVRVSWQYSPYSNSLHRSSSLILHVPAMAKMLSALEIVEKYSLIWDYDFPDTFDRTRYFWEPLSGMYFNKENQDYVHNYFIDTRFKRMALHSGPRVPVRWYACPTTRRPLRWYDYLYRIWAPKSPKWKEQVEDLCCALKLLSGKEYLYLYILLAEYGYGHEGQINTLSSSFAKWTTSESDRKYIRSLLAEGFEDDEDSATQATETDYSCP